MLTSPSGPWDTLQQAAAKMPFGSILDERQGASQAIVQRLVAQTTGAQRAS